MMISLLHDTVTIIGSTTNFLIIHLHVIYTIVALTLQSPSALSDTEAEKCEDNNDDEDTDDDDDDCRVCIRIVYLTMTPPNSRGEVSSYLTAVVAKVSLVHL